MLRRFKKNGFTLIELVIASGVLIFGLVALLATFIYCLELIETTKNSSLALKAAEEVLEQMRRSDFLNVYSNYNGYTFSVSGMPANTNLGRVTVNNSDPDLLAVDIGVCWKQRNERIIGECQESGGVLVFSDSDSNGILDSPVMLETRMAQR